MPRKSLLCLALLTLTAINAGASEQDKVRCYKHFYDKNYREALPYCERSAAAGDTVGKHLLGNMLLLGDAGTQDKVKGLSLLKSAAETGDSNAQKDYGMAFQHGVGIAQDMSQACDWWEKSAKQNNFLAQQYIAGCYLTAIGKGKDMVKGYAYLLLAEKGGNPQAPQILEMIRPSLSPGELSAAEKLSATLTSNEK
jgi:TPR repeat protein